MEGSNSQWQMQLWSNDARLQLKLSVKLDSFIHIYQFDRHERCKSEVLKEAYTKVPES